ncbi:MAG: hypothetical protein AAF621_02660 [Pseudomonadota bacterium]
MRYLFILLSCWGLISCSPIKSYHGFNATDRLTKSAERNTLSKSQVLAQFGPASIEEESDDKEILYYVSYTKERYAFFRPEIVDRKVTALTFEENMLANVDQFGLKDGNIIDINTNKTPTYGKELNVVQQILSNVGRFNSTPGGQRNDGAVLGRIPGGL